MNDQNRFPTQRLLVGALLTVGTSLVALPGCESDPAPPQPANPEAKEPKVLDEGALKTTVTAPVPDRTLNRKRPGRVK